MRRNLHISVRWSFPLAAAVFTFSWCGWASAEPAVDAAPLAEVVPEIPAEPPRLPDPEGKVQAMPKPHRVWVDAEQQRVLVDGYVSLDEGLLEMFACPQGTKEHESIVGVHCSAQVVHAALLAVGAKPGHPVRWDPKFEPPAGTEIEIEVRWLDADKKWQSQKAQQWITDVKAGKPMTHPWVFAGSGFWKDEESGDEFYLAERGDLICVSNFSSATLDIPVESSQVNDGLMFEANKKNIPAIGTPVRLVLTPKRAAPVRKRTNSSN